MSHQRILQLTSLLCATAACRAAQPLATLHMRPEVTVRAAGLTVGHVARVASSDASLVRTIGAIALGNAPTPGHARLIGADTIKIRLLYAGIDPSLVQFDGTVAKVRTEARRIASKDLVAMVIDHARKRLPYPPEDVDITVARAPRDEVVPVGDKEIVFRVGQLGRGRPWGKTQFIVRAMAGNTVLFRTAVYLDIRVFGKVAVALADIARGETFTAENIGLKRVDLISAPGGLSTVEPFLGRKAGRPIRPFSQLDLRMVAQLDPAMKRGDIVTMVLQKGALRILAQAQVVEDGRLGQTVRVRNLSSSRQAYGTVVDARTVRVVF